MFLLKADHFTDNLSTNMIEHISEIELYIILSTVSGAQSSPYLFIAWKNGPIDSNKEVTEGPHSLKQGVTEEAHSLKQGGHGRRTFTQTRRSWKENIHSNKWVTESTATEFLCKT